MAQYAVFNTVVDREPRLVDNYMEAVRAAMREGDGTIIRWRYEMTAPWETTAIIVNGLPECVGGGR